MKVIGPTIQTGELRQIDKQMGATKDIIFPASQLIIMLELYVAAFSEFKPKIMFQIK